MAAPYFLKHLEENEEGDKTLQMRPVSSSNLAAVGYHNGNMYIRFKSGWRYVYYDVPPWAMAGLMRAGSKGKFHHRNIKWNYPYERIE